MNEVKFIRTTHVNGEPVASQTEDVKIYGLGVHALSPETAMTFSEYVDNHVSYAALYDDFKMPSIMLHLARHHNPL